MSFANAELQEFIDYRPDAREARKALAVKLVYQAPNCPSQNPIEDIWLQAKTWVRRFCALISSFSHLKWMEEVVSQTHKRVILPLFKCTELFQESNTSPIVL